LTQALRALNTNYRLAQTHFNRWVASTNEVDLVTLRYVDGDGDLDLVLDAQRRRSQSQIAYYQALTEYNKTIALVHRRKGTTLDYCGVTFAEGPWVGKAYVDAEEHARRRGASREMNYAFTRPAVVSQGPRPAGGNATSDWAPEMVEGVEVMPSEMILESEIDGGVFEGEMSNEMTLELEGYGEWQDAQDTVSQQSTDANRLRSNQVTTPPSSTRSMAMNPPAELSYPVRTVSATEEIVAPQPASASQRGRGQSYRPTRKSVAQIKPQ